MTRSLHNFLRGIMPRLGKPPPKPIPKRTRKKRTKPRLQRLENRALTQGKLISASKYYSTITRDPTLIVLFDKIVKDTLTKEEFEQLESALKNYLLTPREMKYANKLIKLGRYFIKFEWHPDVDDVLIIMHPNDNYRRLYKIKK